MRMCLRLARRYVDGSIHDKRRRRRVSLAERNSLKPVSVVKSGAKRPAFIAAYSRRLWQPARRRTVRIVSNRPGAFSLALPWSTLRSAVVNALSPILLRFPRESPRLLSTRAALSVSCSACAAVWHRSQSRYQPQRRVGVQRNSIVHRVAASVRAL